MVTFSLELAQQLYNSDKEFPVSFNDAWKWLEYSRKDSAKRHFLGCNFNEGFDYEIHISEELRPQGGFSHSVEIRMTTDCFKMWGMMTGTDKGHEIRQYFLQCEKQLKKKLQKEIEDYQKQKEVSVETVQFLEFFKQFLIDTIKMADSMTIEQRLKFFNIFDDFNNKILQYSKVGMVGMAQMLANIIGVSNIYDDNMRLAVQVQKEYRESTEAKVQICEKIKDYIQPYSDEQLLTASELYEHLTGKKAPCYIVGKLANDLKKQGITYTNFKEKKKAYLLTPEIVEKAENIIEVLKITQGQRVEEFFKECTEKSEKFTLTAEILYDNYKAYCEMMGWVVDTQTAFGREASKYATKIRKAKGYIYRGITLK